MPKKMEYGKNLLAGRHVACFRGEEGYFELPYEVCMQSTPLSTEAPVRRCIRQAELLAMLGGISRFTLLRWESEGKFPKRFALAGGLVLWDLDEVERWLAVRRDEARQSAPETEA